MTVRMRVSLFCDWPACFIQFRAGADKAAPAREQAAKPGHGGWRSIYGLDFCGVDIYAGSRDPRSLRLYPQGHALLFDGATHEPVFTRVSKNDPKLPYLRGWYRSTCSCGGWTSPQDQPDKTMSGAAELWLRHFAAEVQEGRR